MAEAVTSKTWSHPRHPLIEARMDICSGRCRIKGTRLTTDWITSCFRGGCSFDELANLYDNSAPERRVEAALRFALDQSAMRAWRKWRRDAVDRQLVAAEAKLQEVTANAKRAVEAQEKELAPLRRDYAECVGDHQHKNALLAKAEDESEALKAEIAALREQGSAHDAEVAAKARAEALEVECTRVCTNCSRRVAVRWCSKWKFFYHGEPRYACSASAIRELFAARWPEQFGPKESR